MEHAALYAALEQARGGRGSVVLLEGPAGADVPAGRRGQARIAELHAAVLLLVWPPGERAPAPALLAIDDARWCDELSVGFLAHIALRVGEFAARACRRAAARRGSPVA